MPFGMNRLLSKTALQEPFRGIGTFDKKLRHQGTKTPRNQKALFSGIVQQDLRRLCILLPWNQVWSHGCPKPPLYTGTIGRWQWKRAAAVPGCVRDSIGQEIIIYIN
jgi:hypothetical protein